MPLTPSRAPPASEPTLVVDGVPCCVVKEPGSNKDIQAFAQGRGATFPVFSKVCRMIGSCVSGCLEGEATSLAAAAMLTGDRWVASPMAGEGERAQPGRRVRVPQARHPGQQQRAAAMELQQVPGELSSLPRPRPPAASVRHAVLPAVCVVAWLRS